MAQCARLSALFDRATKTLEATIQQK